MCVEEIIDKLSQEEIFIDRSKSTAEMSFLEIGGKSKLVVYPRNKNQLLKVLKLLKRCCAKFSIVGNCSNVFFDSEGYNGVIVSTKLLDDIRIEGKQLEAFCGALVTDCALKAMNESLSGMEFLCGIPGSVGGAVYMNAFAYGEEISNIFSKCEAYDLDKEVVVELAKSDLNFIAKGSTFSKNRNLIIMSVEFNLQFSDKLKIREAMLKNSLRRIKSQPLELGNCGSTFKRPKNSYASKIIDELGFKGKRVGGAMVSQKHAGFIVNFDNASSNDVLTLMENIKTKTKTALGICLEQEIIFLE